jgi:hypothetical protein
MSQKTLYSPAKTGTTVIVDSQSYQFIIFSAPALAGGETCSVSINVPDGLTAVAAADIAGVTTGLTASNPTRVFFGGPQYKLVLSTTASNCGLYADFGSRLT